MTRSTKRPLLPPDSQQFQNQTAFRILERTIKRKGPVDANLFACLNDAKATTLQLFDSQCTAYSFPGFEGMFLIKKAIPNPLQFEIVQQALHKWTMPPNVSNLDSHFHVPIQGIWNAYKNWKEIDQLNGIEEEPKVKKRLFEGLASESQLTGVDITGLKPCELKKAKVISIYDPETKLMIDSPVDSMLRDGDQPIEKVLNRLRWVTLGYQYNWSKKEYHFERVPPFPPFLASISQHIVEQTSCLTDYNPDTWKPEAGIVNFYQPKDSLTAHQDKSEVNKISPLLSLSIGLDCVFLFGSEDRGKKPICLLLESGDIVIMSGNARQAFHGVPRVLEGTCPEHLRHSTSDPLLSSHLEHTRCNINIRQVF